MHINRMHSHNDLNNLLPETIKSVKPALAFTLKLNTYELKIEISFPRTELTSTRTCNIMRIEDLKD